MCFLFFICGGGLFWVVGFFPPSLLLEEYKQSLTSRKNNIYYLTEFMICLDRQNNIF